MSKATKSKAQTKAASTKPKPAQPLEQDIVERVMNLNTDDLIFKALRKIEPGNQRGNINKCWKLDIYTRFEAAKLHLIEHASAANIFEQLREGFDEAGVEVRSLSGWLKAVRKSYGAVHSLQLGEIENAQAFAFQSGDLVALMALTIAKTAPKYIAWFTNQELDAMSTTEMHVMLRFIETQTTAAKVQAEARQREAQTVNILSKIREASAEGQDGKRDPGEALKDINNLIRSLMGLPVTEEQIAEVAA